MSNYIGICSGFTGGGVRTVSIDSHGKLLIAGEFTKFKNIAFGKIIRLYPDGSIDNTFNPGGSGFPSGQWVANSCIGTDGKIYIGGTFYQYNGSSYGGKFFSLTTGGTVNTDYNYYEIPNSFRLNSNGKIYLTANVASSYDTTYNLRVLNSNGTNSGFELYSDDSVDYNTQVRLRRSNNPTRYFAETRDAIPDSNGKIYVVGQFNTFNNVKSNGIIKINADGTKDTSFNTTGSTVGFTYTVDDLKCIPEVVLIDNNGKIVVGGRLNKYGTTAINYLCRLNSDGSLDNSFTAKAFGGTFGEIAYGYPIQSMVFDANNKLYVGGYFKTYDGVTVNNLVRLNSDGTIDTGFSGGTGFNSTISTLAIDDENNLIVGGDFTTYKGNAAPGIIKLDSQGNSLITTLCILASTGLTSTSTFKSITLNWHNNETSHINYNTLQLYSGGTWNNIADVSSGSTSYTFTGLSPNSTYKIRVAVKYDNKYYPSYYINKSTTTLSSPSGLTATLITYDTINLSWVNNDSGYDNNIIQSYYGGTWHDVATLINNSTTYSYSGLIQGTQYILRISARYNSVDYSSASITETTTAVIAPSDAYVDSIGVVDATLHWTNNGCGDGIRVYNKLNSAGSYTLLATIGCGNTSYHITGLTPGEIYKTYVTTYYSGGEFSSGVITYTLQNPYAPSGLTYSNSTCTGFNLSWKNSGLGLGLKHIDWYPLSGGTIVLASGLAANTTGYTVTNLHPDDTYIITVTNNYLGTDYESSSIYAHTLIPQPASGFTCVLSGCSTMVMNWVNGTCGISQILVQNYGSWNTIATLPGSATTFTYTGTPTSNLFRIISVVNGIQYPSQSYVGEIPLVLEYPNIKYAQCGPFDKSPGRIFFPVDNFITGHTYSFSAYRSDSTLYYFKSGITSQNDFVINSAPPDCYTAIIHDDTCDCSTVTDSYCVQSLEPYSLGGIKKLWLAVWSDDLDYNYWSTADDDYFLPFLDSSEFTSTKIKEYLSISGGTGSTWYIIPVAPQIAKIDQKLNKVRQGYIFEDQITFAISAADALKWQKMSIILNPENKWYGIIQDANDNYWTFGYRHGGRVNTYSFTSGQRGEDNGYQLVISSQSENKILTAIDKQYVIDNIL